MTARRVRLVIGMMSGTSADGVDAVLAEISETSSGLRAKVRAHLHRRYPPRLRDRILAVCVHGTVTEICELNFEIGSIFARAALMLIQRAGIAREALYAIGSHGQTIHHLPNARVRSTLQVGEPAVIAEMTGVTTVADFRVRDVAAGGQGAPLVPFADFVLFRHQAKPRIIQNIGGIANLTFLPCAPSLDQVLAFDTGPGNMIMDGLVARFSKGRMSFDRRGAWAARGRVDEKLLSCAMRHPFLAREIPKTTGREEFGAEFISLLVREARKARVTNDDLLATATALTAASISDAYRRFVLPRLSGSELREMEVIVGGGGAYNETLMAMLQGELPHTRVTTHEPFGIGNLQKEALAFALLAHETLRGRPSNVPSATGAKRPVVLGKITPP